MSPFSPSLITPNNHKSETITPHISQTLNNILLEQPAKGKGIKVDVYYDTIREYIQGGEFNVSIDQNSN